MTNTKIIANKVSAFIEKNLRGNTPFQNTSDFISYIGYKESKTNNENNSSESVT